MTPDARAPARVLFVCTGNLCRSPTAEGLLRAALDARGLGTAWTVLSAGTHAQLGLAPPALAIACAAELGADIANIRSQPVSAIDLAACARIVALDRGHLELLRVIAPAACAGRIDLLPAAAGRGRLDVPDPYGGTRQDYALVARLIAGGVARLADELAAVSGRGR